jgi:enoyl-CoA hydratase/carnithine racemase
MASELLQCTVTDGVADVVIDHPPTNLVDGPFIGALAGILDRLDADDTVRVVVFASADPTFPMHGDVHGILAIPADHPRTAERRRRFRAPPQSVRLHRCLDGAAAGGAEFSVSTRGME